jgi:ATP-dependent exoDNAse (exonuclease V) alpha subunit
LEIQDDSLTCKEKYLRRKTNWIQDPYFECMMKVQGWRMKSNNISFANRGGGQKKNQEQEKTRAYTPPTPQEQWAKVCACGAPESHFGYRVGDPVIANKKILDLGIVNGDILLVAGFVPLRPPGQSLQCVFALPNNEKNSSSWAKHPANGLRTDRTNKDEGPLAIILADLVQERLVCITERDMETVFSPAYCVTVHKAQGAEYEHVFFMSPHVEVSSFDTKQPSEGPKYDYYRLLTRRLLYTSVTRAKSVFTAYGWRAGYQLCLDDSYELPRRDFLGAIL